jgi:hypothetical protein
LLFWMRCVKLFVPETVAWFAVYLKKYRNTPQFSG